MANSPENSDGLRDPELERALDLLIEHLDKHINRGIFVLNAKAEQSKDPGDYDRYKCASLMLLNAGISLQNIRKYYGPIILQTKDVVVLFRVIFEGILNSLYVLASDPDIANKALRHAEQKNFRHHGSVLELGPYKISLTVDPYPEKIKSIVNEFTSKRGRELNWTPHSNRKIIQIIADKYGENIWLTLGQAYIGYYGFSSEYIHSSMYSILNFLGNNDKDGFFVEMKNTLWTCLVEVGSAVLGLLDILETETGIQEFRIAAKDTTGILLNVCQMLGNGEASDAD